MNQVMLALNDIDPEDVINDDYLDNDDEINGDGNSYDWIKKAMFKDK
jgi:hypothetical protein